MKERFVTGWCALGVLLLFLTMFVHVGGSSAARTSAARPTTEETGADGYRAAMQWLQTAHVPVFSQRERFDRLARRPGLARQGNLLVLTLPAATPIRAEEFRSLDRWVRAGNTLLILAALADDPAWAHPFEGLAASDLNLLSGLEFENVHSHELRKRPKTARSSGFAPRPPVAGHALSTPERATLIPNRAHPYLDAVKEGVALSDYPTEPWTVKVPYDGFVFVLAHQRGSGEGALWVRQRDAGHIVISSLGSLFTNRAIGLGDNARLLANIVATSVGPGGSVLFDDIHQGLGAAYDPARFYRDPRLYWTVVILCVVWLSWVLGATRLRAPPRAVPAPRESELVQATGKFLARVLSSSAAGGLLIEHFLRRWPWHLLERHPRVAPDDLRRLRSWHADATAARSVPLRRLHELLVRLDTQLRT